MAAGLDPFRSLAPLSEHKHLALVESVLYNVRAADLSGVPGAQLGA